MTNEENGIDFDEIRPYNDEEVPAAIAELCAVPYFTRVLNYLFPTTPAQKVIDSLLTIKTVDEFQAKFIMPFLDNLIKNTTRGVTASGLENVDAKQTHLFMTNHRDIVLDSALMNYKLNEYGISTTEIGIGDNLLIYKWITDLVKLNKSFVVRRGLPAKQMIEASGTLSAFIRKQITEDGHSIWISQREGRTKDGDDHTQSSVLKMLSLSGDRRDNVTNFAELRLLPVSISYEYDPTDYLKAYQFQLQRDLPDYKKTQEDDLQHMNVGIRGHKGRVHFSFGTAITAEELRLIDDSNRKLFIQNLAEKIDEQIHQNYHLWPCNYAAFDMLTDTTIMKNKYSAEEKEQFESYINEHISRLDDDPSANLKAATVAEENLPKPDRQFVLYKILQMYANPVVNKLKQL